MKIFMVTALRPKALGPSDHSTRKHVDHTTTRAVLHVLQRACTVLGCKSADLHSDLGRVRRKATGAPRRRRARASRFQMKANNTAIPLFFVSAPTNTLLHGWQTTGPATIPRQRNRTTYQASCISWHNKSRATWQLNATLASSKSSKKRDTFSPHQFSPITCKARLSTLCENRTKKGLHLRTTIRRRRPNTGLFGQPCLHMSLKAGD